MRAHTHTQNTYAPTLQSVPHYVLSLQNLLRGYQSFIFFLLSFRTLFLFIFRGTIPLVVT